VFALLAEIQDILLSHLGVTVKDSLQFAVPYFVVLILPSCAPRQITDTVVCVIPVEMARDLAGLAHTVPRIQYGCVGIEAARLIILA